MYKYTDYTYVHVCIYMYACVQQLKTCTCTLTQLQGSRALPPPSPHLFQSYMAASKPFVILYLWEYSPRLRREQLGERGGAFVSPYKLCPPFQKFQLPVTLTLISFHDIYTCTYTVRVIGMPILTPPVLPLSL